MIISKIFQSQFNGTLKFLLKIKIKKIFVQEAARTMLNEEKLFDGYWRDDIRKIVYILNKGHLKININKTPYELWFGRAPSIKYFKVFGNKFYIKRLDKNLRKFDVRSGEGC
jgi:hypothetical protein